MYIYRPEGRNNLSKLCYCLLADSAIAIKVFDAQQIEQKQCLFSYDTHAAGWWQPKFYKAQLLQLVPLENIWGPPVIDHCYRFWQYISISDFDTLAVTDFDLRKARCIPFLLRSSGYTTNLWPQKCSLCLNSLYHQ